MNILQCPNSCLCSMGVPVCDLEDKTTTAPTTKITVNNHCVSSHISAGPQKAVIIYFCLFWCVELRKLMNQLRFGCERQKMKNCVPYTNSVRGKNHLWRLSGS